MSRMYVNDNKLPVYSIDMPRVNGTTIDYKLKLSFSDGSDGETGDWQTFTLKKSPAKLDDDQDSVNIIAILTLCCTLICSLILISHVIFIILRNKGCDE